MKNIIKKVVLDLDGKEVELTLEQAKKLHELLNELCGEKKTEYVPYPVRYYYWSWNRPYWHYDGPTWTSSDGSSSACYSDCIVTLSI